MKVKMILPALTEAVSPFFRALKYSLFPPLGLATLAGFGRYPGKHAGRPATRPASLAAAPPWDAASWARRNNPS